MPGTGIVLGASQVPLLMGTYLRIRSGEAPPDQVRGTFGLVAASDWGPLNTPTTVTSASMAASLFGTGGTIATLAAEAFTGGALQGVILRAGSAGAAGSLILQDTLAATALTLPLKYKGTRALKATYRNVLGDTTRKELVIYDGTAIQEVTRIPTSGNQPTALAAALATSAFIGTPVVAGGAGTTLADVSQVAFTGGSAVTVDAAAFTAGMTAIQLAPWFCLILGSEDASIQATVAAYLDGLFQNGYRRVAVVGQPSGVALATRLTDAQAINDPLVGQVIGGFVTRTGTLNGMYFAARVGGFAAAMQPTWTLTAVPVPDATDVLETFSQDDLKDILLAGAIGAQRTALGRFVTTQGVSTWTDTTKLPPWAQSLDSGWQSFDRAPRLIAVVDSLTAAIEDLLTDPDMDRRPRMEPASLADLVKLGQSVLDSYKPRVLQAATLRLDPGRPPAGRTVYLQIDPFQDVAGAEIVVIELTTTTT